MGRTGAARRSAPARTADPYADALGSGRGPLFLRGADGSMLALEVERWCADVDHADTTVLRRCEGAVLDVGCGPGRMVVGLAARGQRGLGIDTHPAAVRRTRAAGGRALRRSVFDALPGEGGWPTALLLDGNIGIGGDPEDLLARMADVVAPGGLLLVEVAGEDVDERLAARICDASGRCTAPFAWARVGAAALAATASRTSWTVVETWSCGRRLFTALRRRERL
ncbi:class I SAM-dependent methyltransferase [Streptomonospora litoralis]|uniref:Methyltransferase domain protein n=1 Tax=Streptomonospora litoralis TaxID=2498135 RepID=A0A4P6Q0R9_9ACTN|nr:class I SAM-dependent methyltransferase [Streptomonospora litoralis]QBI54033.1 Methyltransferase domain protein [Streptomonospora litoralis]